jgi:hypothetical protein
MRSEEIDKKVQEAAEKHHPAYDEKAWQKMEKLLNEHLPVKEDDRRRVFLLLLLFLLIGGGGVLLLSKPWNKNPNLASGSRANNEQLVNEKKPQSENANLPSTPAVTPGSSGHGVGSSESATGVLNLPDKQGTSQNTHAQQRNFTRANVQPVQRSETPFSPKSETADNSIPSNSINQSHPSEATKETTAIQNPVESKKDESVKQNVTKSVEPITQAATNPEAQTTKPPIHKEKSNWLSGFAFLLSAGPDVSKAGQSDLGKVTLAYGAGISYTKSRFTLRTGVYAARKIYNAGPSDYKLAWQPSNLKFEGAKANCYVMEIPVQLFYNFPSKNRSNWFAGAGLSSYLMKRETYDYQFKSNSGAGTPYNWQYEYTNDNKHYFSVLDLSGGYSIRLNKTVSLSAEPYLKIPLTGIGEGKVDLKGGGVLFTLGIEPFK